MLIMIEFYECVYFSISVLSNFISTIMIVL